MAAGAWALLLAAAPRPAAAHEPHVFVGGDDGVWTAEGMPGMHHFRMFSGRGRLGVQLQPLGEDLRRFFGAPDREGVLVAHVEPKSVAERAGLRAGDVVLQVDGKKVDDAGDVVSAIADKKEGDKVAIVVVRDKRRHTLTATMDKASEPRPMRSFFLHQGDVDKKLDARLKAIEERLQKLEKK